MFVQSYRRSRPTLGGFTLIEALVFMVLFSITTLTFYRTYSAAAIQIIEAKRRTAAVELANERMEQIRNVPYVEIGVDSGSPDGRLNPDEVAVVNDINFRMVLSVAYIDDSNDGTLSLGTDLTDYDDYKRVKVYILWGQGTDQGSVTTAQAIGTSFERQRIELTSTFTPPGGLEGSSENGVLSINTIESDGTPVNAASLTITCTDCSGGGPVNIADTTDANGGFIRSIPPSTSNEYNITVEKSGYETLKTQIPYDGVTQLYNPNNEHLTVLLGELTTSTFIMNPLSDFTVSVRDPFCEPLSTAGPYTFDIAGGRSLGTDPTTSPSEDVFSLDDFFSNTTKTTDGSGDVTIYSDTNADSTIATDGSDAAGYGSYTVDSAAFETANPSLTFWKLVPGEGVNPNVTQVEAASVGCNFIVLDEDVNGVFVTVTDETDPTNIIILEDTTIRLQNTGLGYSTSALTDQFGKVYFPTNSNDTLTAATYDLRVTLPGYDEYQDLVTITSGLEQISIALTPE